MKIELYGQTIWLYRKAIDFRRSIDGLVDLVSRELKISFLMEKIN